MRIGKLVLSALSDLDQYVVLHGCLICVHEEACLGFMHIPSMQHACHLTAKATHIHSVSFVFDNRSQATTMQYVVSRQCTCMSSAMWYL